jgi:cell division septation protein DedD
VIRDANANGKADPGEESMNGAVVVLDAGARSEQVRGGRFRFEAVRSGSHAIKLLIESLPGGAAIKGDAEVPAVLARDRMSAEATFLVTVEKRPEIRRVFPPRGGGAAAAGTPARGRGGAAPAGAAGAPSKPSRPAGSAARPGGAGPAASPSRGRFAIQIAALSDRSNAQSLLDELKAAGLPAYITQPGSPDGGLYRIRVGPYATRSAAQKALGALEEARGEKLWVTRER